MNLGSLVSISAQAAENLIILIFDNSVYEVTGAQGTPASAGCRADGSNLQFAEIARACGFRSVFEFNELEHWKQQIPAVLANPGPTLAVLHVAPVPNAVGPRSPGPARNRAQQFRAALDGTKTSSDTC